MADRPMQQQARERIASGIQRVSDALAFADEQFREAADELEIMGWPGRSRQLLAELPEPLGKLMKTTEDLIRELEPKA